jgi:hypothetical protein
MPEAPLERGLRDLLRPPTIEPRPPSLVEWEAVQETLRQQGAIPPPATPEELAHIEEVLQQANARADEATARLIQEAQEDEPEEEPELRLPARNGARITVQGHVYLLRDGMWMSRLLGLSYPNDEMVRQARRYGWKQEVCADHVDPGLGPVYTNGVIATGGTVNVPAGNVYATTGGTFTWALANPPLVRDYTIPTTSFQ